MLTTPKKTKNRAKTAVVKRVFFCAVKADVGQQRIGEEKSDRTNCHFLIRAKPAFSVRKEKKNERGKNI